VGDELMAALGGALLFGVIALLVVVVDLLRSHGRVLRGLHERGLGEPASLEQPTHETPGARER
jgi:hypothetical protein